MSSAVASKTRIGYFIVNQGNTRCGPRASVSSFREPGPVMIVISHLCRSQSTHTAPTPVLTGSEHAHILTKPFRAVFAVSRSELIEPGAATCVFRGMAGPRFKFQKLGTYVPGTRYQYSITVFFLLLKKFCRARLQPTLGRPNVYHVGPETCSK